MKGFYLEVSDIFLNILFYFREYDFYIKMIGIFVGYYFYKSYKYFFWGCGLIYIFRFLFVKVVNVCIFSRICFFDVY